MQKESVVVNNFETIYFLIDKLYSCIILYVCNVVHRPPRMLNEHIKVIFMNVWQFNCETENIPFVISKSPIVIAEMTVFSVKK